MLSINSPLFSSYFQRNQTQLEIIQTTWITQVYLYNLNNKPLQLISNQWKWPKFPHNSSLNFYPIFEQHISLPSHEQSSSWPSELHAKRRVKIFLARSNLVSILSACLSFWFFPPLSTNTRSPFRRARVTTANGSQPRATSNAITFDYW